LSPRCIGLCFTGGGWGNYSVRLKKSVLEADGYAGFLLPEWEFQEGSVQSVLVVEDSATMRTLIASTLEEIGVPLKITDVPSGFEALRLLPRERFDLIVTDINMPDINGLELVSFLKGNAAYRSIPLIIVSTESSDRDREKGLSLGADAYLVKPFEPDDLLRIVRDLLASPQQDG
jgi:two-component system chemotaxis response regulator CheY